MHPHSFLQCFRALAYPLHLVYLSDVPFQSDPLRLFQKHIRADELGAMLYELLRHGMQSGEDLSLEHYLSSVEKMAAELDEQYVGEIMVGLLFGATLAIERSATPRVAEQLVASMKAEFLNHIQEQGASPIEKAEWETIVAARFLDYRKCLDNYSGFEPPWRLGRVFFWNVTGTEEHIAMSIKISTLYLLAARDACQELLNVYGPTLIVGNRM